MRTHPSVPGWMAGASLSINDKADSADPGPETDPGTRVQFPVFGGIRLLGGSDAVRGYFQLHAGIGFGFGAGFLVKGIHAAIRFYRMAEAEHDVESEEGFVRDGKEKVNTTLLHVLLGVNFGP